MKQLNWIGVKVANEGGTVFNEIFAGVQLRSKLTLFSMEPNWIEQNGTTWNGMEWNDMENDPCVFPPPGICRMQIALAKTLPSIALTIQISSPMHSGQSLHHFNFTPH